MACQRALVVDCLIVFLRGVDRYGKFLMRELQRAPEPRALRCLSGPEVQSLRLARDFGTVHCDEAGAEAWPGALLVGMPGPACGHVVEASSYFDR